MKNPIIAGAIAGIVMGIGAMFSQYPASWLGLYEPNPLPPLFVFLGILGFDVIWGIILAIIFSILYNSIPSKGILKGFVYGLIIFIISNLRGANLLWSFGFHEWAMVFAWSGLFAPTLYGITLGYLYKK